MPCNTVLKLFPYSSLIVSYSEQRSIKLVEDGKDVFYALTHFLVEERLALYCVQSTLPPQPFYSQIFRTVEH